MREGGRYTGREKGTGRGREVSWEGGRYREREEGIEGGSEVSRQRMWKENLQVFKNLYVLYTSHEKTLTTNYIWFNFILGWCWHVMLRGRSGPAEKYRNIVLLTKFLGEMKVIFLVCNFPSLLLWHLWLPNN